MVWISSTPIVKRRSQKSFFSASDWKFGSDMEVSTPRSAPAEKNRPEPVMMVKVVSGCLLSVCSASMVSWIMLLLNVFRDLGRLNWCLCVRLDEMEDDGG